MTRKLKAAAAVLPLLLWTTPSLAQGYAERGGFWHPMSGWGHVIFGGFMMIAFWGGIIVLIVLLVRRLGGAGTAGHLLPPSRRTPLDILQERFARGEIDKEEYEERKRLLSD